MDGNKFHQKIETKMIKELIKIKQNMIRNILFKREERKEMKREKDERMR